MLFRLPAIRTLGEPAGSAPVQIKTPVNLTAAPSPLRRSSDDPVTNMEPLMMRDAKFDRTAVVWYVQMTSRVRNAKSVHKMILYK